MSAEYNHEKHAGNHADVLKHCIFCAVIQELQKVHPEGLMVADTHAGVGVYDLTNTQEHKDGISKVVRRYSLTKNLQDIPPAIREYTRLTLAAVGSEGYDDFELYPGSPLLAQALLRKGVDEHRLTDMYVTEVEGLDRPVDFRQLDCYDPESLDWLMPSDSDKHNVVLIDAAFTEEGEYGQVKQLLQRILERNPKATVLVWIPFIHGHRFRWSFATGLREVAKESAKVGRYYANIVIAKAGLQGSAMLVCNPTPLFDDVVDPTALHWLAHVMNQGKDEYTVEQIMKKKKKKNP